MGTSHRLALVLLLAAVPGFAGAQAISNTQFKSTTLTLSASAEIDTAPDMATVMIGVEARNPQAGAAFAANNAAMNAVVAALRNAGVAGADLQTSSLNMQSQFTPVNGQQVFSTYLASSNLTLTVRDLGKISALLDAAVAAGASRILSLSFGLQNPKPVQDQARESAIKDLAERADIYAKGNGYKVARIVSLNDGGGGGSPVIQRIGREDLTTPISAGQYVVRVGLTAVYELRK
ncbi:MAG: hypothetical protein JWM33_472 [Caulobacteraceae bacterium]|nr:hypothetical protein [Caulobacteraceae bacterium]